PPNRADGVHCDASTSGVNPSVPPASLDHRSVYPAATTSSIHDLCSCRGTPSKGIVRPQRWSLTGRLLSPCSNHRRLAGGGEQRAVLSRDVFQVVAEAVHDGVDADVEQYLVGSHDSHQPDRVFEAVFTCPDCEGLT